jgi:hypothetical protein
MNLDTFNNTPASFGRKLTDMALAAGGQAAGAYLGTKIPGIGAGMAVNNPAPVTPMLGENYRRNQAFGQLARVGR